MKNMLLILTAFMCLLTIPANAQSILVKQWDKVFGGDSDDRMFVQVPLVDGGYLLAGDSRSSLSGDRSEWGRGQEDFWLVKIDAYGNKVWDKTYGGLFADILRAVVPTSDGGYLLAGYSQSNIYAEKSQNSRGQNDFWVLKIDANGSKLWDKTFGGSGDDRLMSAVLTPDGGFLLGGDSNSGISGERTESSRGSTDYWVVRISSVGTKLWDRAYGGSDADMLASIQITSTGHYYLCGYSFSNISGQKTQNSKGSSDYWVVKIDALGTKVWDKTIGGNSLEFLWKSAIGLNDELVAGGFSYSNISSDKSETSFGLSDYWVVKLDAAGNKLWDKTFGGTGDEEIRAIFYTGDNSFVIAGNSTSGISGNKSDANIGNYDYWLVKVNNDGVKQWDKTIGGAGDDQCQTILTAPGGGYMIAGRSNSNISGDKSQNSKGLYDFWTVYVREFSCNPAISPAVLPNGLINQAYSQTLSTTGGTFPITYSVVSGSLPTGITCTQSGSITGIPTQNGSFPFSVRSVDANGCSDTASYLVQIQLLTANKLWDITAGGNSFERLRTLLPLEDGSFLAGGESNSNISGNKSQQSKGGLDFWLVKMNSLGSKIWDKTFGGSLNDNIVSVVHGPANCFYLCGQSYSGISGDKTESSRGDLDYWIVKTDSLGNKVWDRTYGGSGEDRLVRAIATTDGGCIMAGRTLSGSTGDKSEPSRGGYDCWLVKVDAMGNKVWDKTFGGSGTEDMGSLIALADNGLLIAMSSGSNTSGDKSGNSKGGTDFWLVRTDQNGNKLWDKTIGGNNNDPAFSITATTGNGYFIAGRSKSNISFDKSENARDGIADYWVVKTDSFCNKIWDKTIGGDSLDALTGIALTADGGIILSGYSSSSIGFDKTDNKKGLNDFWLVKLDANGYKQWDKTYGGSGDEQADAITILANGTVIAAGLSNSPVSGNKTSNGNGNYDFWIINLAEAVVAGNQQSTTNTQISEIQSSTENENKTDFVLKSYPNPANDQVDIIFQSDSRQACSYLHINIFNNSGKLVAEKEVKNTDHVRISLKSLPAGSYFLTASCDNYKQAKKILLARQ